LGDAVQASQQIDKEQAMRFRALAVAILGLSLGGCILTDTLDPVSETVMSPRDQKLIKGASYLQHKPSQDWLRHRVDYTGPEKPGTVVVDTERKHLFLVLEGGKAYRYGVTVGEEGMNWRGKAKVGRKAEWPDWRPTPDTLKRIPDLPTYVSPGPHNPMGARALYLFEGNKDTLFRIHGTNQPEYIGQAISSGCIRMLNEDVIDLYNRVPVGATVVVI
jgi:lipoprotein-anchoring transpeptidase ErfK/SrfK